jgi:DUF4097 and DUF4098 domain-containing protein YvlB
VDKTFQTPGPIALELDVPAGDVDVRATETAETDVRVEPLNDAARELIDDVLVELQGSGTRTRLVVTVTGRRRLLSFRSPEFAVTVTCPSGSDLVVRSASADVEARGSFGSAEVHTASGDATLDHVAGTARVRSASGDVRVRAVDGDAELNTVSGDVDVGRVGGTLVSTLVSGDLTVADAASSVRTKSVSGDQELNAVAEGEVSATSVSGDIRIGVRRGSKLWIDASSVSGSMSSELELSDAAPAGEGPLVEVRAKSVSGDVGVVRAPAPASIAS